MTNPYLAPSLVRARAAINTRWPHRDHSSDGWIGDAAHQATTSDHNPDAKGMVHAIDVDRDGVHLPTIVAAFLVSPVTEYVIFNRRIWQRRDKFAPRVYTGSNPHTGHLHESAQHTRTAEQYGAPWSVIRGMNPDHPWPADLLQAYLNGHWYALAVDSDPGPKTIAAVKRFQQRVGLKVDGIPGPHTRRALMTAGV